MATYEIQRTQKIMQECLVKATSKKEALHLVRNMGVGHFTNDEYEVVYTYRVKDTIVCPECDGTNLTEDKSRCWNCDPGE